MTHSENGKKGADIYWGNKTVSERLWSKIKKTESVEQCWEWTGTRPGGRYGMLRVGRKIRLAHRIVWEDVNGQIPKGLCVCHRCDNEGCCNPHHLFLATHYENMQDMKRKHRHPPCTHRKGVYGDANFNTKYPDNLAQKIIDEFKPYKNSCRKISKQYGIPWNTVRVIIYGIGNRRPNLKRRAHPR